MLLPCMLCTRGLLCIRLNASCALAVCLTLWLVQDASLVMAAATPYDFERVAEQLQASQPLLAALLATLGQEVEGAAAARQVLMHVVSRLREMDVALGGGHTRAADVLQLYASTQVRMLRVCSKQHARLMLGQQMSGMCGAW